MGPGVCMKVLSQGWMDGWWEGWIRASHIMAVGPSSQRFCLSDRKGVRVRQVEERWGEDYTLASPGLGNPKAPETTRWAGDAGREHSAIP